MKCKGCEIWRNRNREKTDMMQELVPGCVRIGLKERELISEEMRGLERKWREHISKMETLCPQGGCILRG